MGEGRSTAIKGSASQEGIDNATTIQTEQLPDTNPQSDHVTEQLGRSDSKSLDAGLAKKGRKTTSRESVPDLFSDASGNGTTSPSGNAEHGSPSTARKDGATRDQSGTTNDLGNYEITDEFLLVKLDYLRTIT